MQINDKKKTAQFILSFLITALMLYVCWLMISPFISVILWSSILVIIFYPLYNIILRWSKRPELSSIITIVISLIFFILPLALISAAVVNELADLASSTLKDVGEILKDPQKARIGYVYDYLNRYIRIERFMTPEELKAFIGRISEFVFQASLNLLSGAIGTFVSIFFAMFTMYYLFRDGKKIVAHLPRILPFRKEQTEKLINHTSELIQATVNGSLLVGALQGFLAGIIFWILGIPSPIILAVLTMIFSFIPFVGTGLVLAPVIIILAFAGEIGKAVILFVYAVLIIGMADNFLLPKLIGKRTRMHELFVFFSVIGGVQLFGMLGLFLGPIILAIALGLFTVFRGEKLSNDEIGV